MQIPFLNPLLNVYYIHIVSSSFFTSFFCVDMQNVAAKVDWDEQLFQLSMYALSFYGHLATSGWPVYGVCTNAIL